MLRDAANLFGVTQKITLEDLSESKSAIEEKSADRSQSVNSMQTATHETTNVAVYEVRDTDRVIVRPSARIYNI